MIKIAKELDSVKGLIIKLVMDYCSGKPYMDFDDAIQIAQMAAMTALKGYDPAKGKLSPRVWARVSTELNRYRGRCLRHMSYTIIDDIDGVPEAAAPQVTEELSTDYMLSLLTERERKIVSLRYGIGCYERSTKEISAIYDLSTSRINRILKEAIAKIEKELK